MHFQRSLWRTFRAYLLLIIVTLLGACGGGGSSDNVIDKDVVPPARKIMPKLAFDDPSFEGEYHSGNVNCATCHDADVMEISTPVPGVTRNVSLGTAWETSMMANSARDPYWQAVVASELDNFPGLEDEINDKCLVCHVPMAYDLAQKDSLDLRLFDKVSEDDGAVLQQGLYSMNKENELFNHAMDGVSCTLCHQMDGSNFGSQESMSGGFKIVGSPSGDPSDKPAYGQYADNIDGGYMRQQAGFLAQPGLHLSTSESCATCHNLNVHAVDPEGKPLPGDEVFAEQAIFTEWQNSDFALGGPQAANCQSCHMPKVDENVPLAKSTSNKRPDFAEHTFLGANTVMQDMLMNFSEELGVDLLQERGQIEDGTPEAVAYAQKASEYTRAAFAASIKRNREFLKTSAQVTLTQAGVTEGKLSFDVTVQNLTGHRLPTGYHSRRVYLHVQVLNSQGELIFESGRIRPDGSIVGVSEDVDPSTWEPHYDVINDETQVQVYQAITGNSEGDRTHSLLASSFYLKDNRLTPSGMDRFTLQNNTDLPATFGTFGKAQSDSDFNNGKDTVTYQVTVPGSDIYTVSAELRYQPLSYGHLQKLWTQGDRVDAIEMFRTIYDATTLRDEVIDTATQIMQ